MRFPSRGLRVPTGLSMAVKWHFMPWMPIRRAALQPCRRDGLHETGSHAASCTPALKCHLLDCRRVSAIHGALCSFSCRAATGRCRRKGRCQRGGFPSVSAVFYWRVSPRVPGVKALMARPLCYDVFAILHSGVTKTPLFVAERLHKAQFNDAKGERRTHRFFADARLPRAKRA